MPTFYSNNAYAANKAGGANQAVAASEVDGKLRVVAFSINLAAIFTSALDGTTALGSTTAAADIIVLGKIPAGYKVLRGTLNGAALGGTATIAIGLVGADGSGFYTGTTADDNDLFRVAAIANTADTDVTFALTNAQNHGYTTTKDCNLTLTIGAAALPASGTLNGYLICSAA